MDTNKKSDTLGADGKVKRDKLQARWGQLKAERSTWVSQWREVSTYLLPMSGRYFVTDRNRGQSRQNAIYDSTGTRALRVLAAGLMGGMTSPARPWFRLTIHDMELAKYAPIKLWLDQVTKLMLDVFARSNTYRALHSAYEELGAFGTAAIIVLPDYDDVIHMYPLTVGEYAVATDYKGHVNTLYREFQKTVAEVVSEFGLENVSKATYQAWMAGNLDQWITIIHAIEPRTDRDLSKQDAKNMPFSSIYFEHGGEPDQYLRESGFKHFPALCPRWAVTGGDIYGNGPGLEALGDIKQLQHEQLRKAQGIDYMTKPPLQIPAGMKNREIDTLPGGHSYVDMAGAQAGIKTAFEVRLDLNHLLADIQDVRGRIQQSFYSDLFMMLANQTDSRMTATEVAERHEEKMLMLGPVLERLNNEMLDPLIEMTFNALVDANLLPPPPEEMQGIDLNVEFVSMLAQAQRAVGTNSIDRFTGTLAAVAQTKPEVLDKFDVDQWADVYSDLLGVDPHLLKSQDEVDQIRQARAEQQAQAQQALQAEQAANTANKLANAPTNEQNALTDVTEMFSGYTTGA